MGTQEDLQEILDNGLLEIHQKYGKSAKLAVVQLLTIQASMNDEAKKETRYIPIPEWNKFHPYPTPNAIRAQIARGQLEGCYKKVNGRVILDENAMLARYAI